MISREVGWAAGPLNVSSSMSMLNISFNSGQVFHFTTEVGLGQVAQIVYSDEDVNDNKGTEEPFLRTGFGGGLGGRWEERRVGKQRWVGRERKKRKR